MRRLVAMCLPMVLTAALVGCGSNANDKSRAKNRRIEIVIVPNIEDLVKMPELGGKTKEPGGDGSALPHGPSSSPPPSPPTAPKPKATPKKK